jgi:hypothetical protein
VGQAHQRASGWFLCGGSIDASWHHPHTEPFFWAKLKEQRKGGNEDIISSIKKQSGKKTQLFYYS